MATFRRYFGLLLVASGLITALYIYQFNPYPNHSWVVSEKVFLVHSNHDVCANWSSAFPSDTIIIISRKSSVFENPRCLYMTKKSSSLEYYVMAMKFQPQLVIVANSNQDPTSCSPNGATRQPTILYSRTNEHIFNSSAHWGYGGIAHDDQKTKYHFSSDLGDPVLSVMTTKFAPAGCRDVYPPMVLGRGAYVRTQQTCLVLTRKAFWTLPLLGVCNTAKERTALSLLAQKLIWNSRDFVEHRVQFREVSQSSDHIFNVTFENAVLEYLRDHSCDENATLQNCLVRMAEELKALQYINANTLQDLKRWVALDSTTRVEFPSKINNTMPMIGKRLEIKSYLFTAENLHPFVQEPNSSINWYFDVNKQIRTATERRTCNPPKATVSSLPPWTQWKNILVIVTFNTATYGSIPLYETLYRPFFPHIVYCGPGYPSMKVANINKFSLRFISFGETPKYLNPGSLNYECLIRASKLGYNVDGYFIVSDDVLLLPHRLQYFNTSKVWTWRLDNMVRVSYENDSFCDDAGCRAEDVPFWLVHKKNTLHALSALQELQNQSSTIEKCAKNIANLYGGPKWSLRILSDITYVPSRFIVDVTDLLQIFLEHEVYLEIAIPTVLHCIIPQEEIEPIYTHFHNTLAPKKPVVYSPLVAEPDRPDLVLMSHRVYQGRRDHAWDHVTGRLFNGIAFFHPYKMKAVATGSRPDVELFCRLLHFMADRTGNLNKITEPKINAPQARKKIQHKPRPKVPTKPKAVTNKGPKVPTKPTPMTNNGTKIPTKPTPMTNNGTKIPTKPKAVTNNGPKVSTKPTPMTNNGPKISTKPTPMTNNGPKVSTKPTPMTNNGPKVSTKPTPMTNNGTKIPTKPNKH